jgi:HAD superfamily hydrolase (TIGR01509 family)
MKHPGSQISAAAGKRLIVFDYDGTLAHLAIDWDALRCALSRRAREFGFNSSFRPLWAEMARLRDRHGMEAVTTLFTIIARYERAGVQRQWPRPEIVALVRGIEAARGSSPGHTPMLAIFSANLHDTIVTGLEALGIESAFSCIIGANDVIHWKPNAEGLRLAMRRTGRTPAETLFIGDSPGDAEAARAAGIDFLRV